MAAGSKSFLEPGKAMPQRPPAIRVGDFNSVYEELDLSDPSTLNIAGQQGGRCMDCSMVSCSMIEAITVAPYTAIGCPGGKSIPDFNLALANYVRLSQLGRQDAALHQLRSAYNLLSHAIPFPLFTGLICPAPCQTACNVGAAREDPIKIRRSEYTIAKLAWQNGLVRLKKGKPTGKRVSIIGSGPAGLAAAWKLRETGHEVTIYEREKEAGGLLMYGIPNPKLEKDLVRMHTTLMRMAGINFQLNAHLGYDTDANIVLQNSDAMILAVGAEKPRKIGIPGEHLNGVTPAMDLLRPMQYNLNNGSKLPDYSGKKIIIVGASGDTSTDVLATVLRLGCRDVVMTSTGKEAKTEKDPNIPWLFNQRTLKIDYAHEEARDLSVMDKDPRQYNLVPVEFLSDDKGHVRGGIFNKKGENDNVMSQVTLEADMIIMATGFDGAEPKVFEQLGLTTKSVIHYPYANHPEANYLFKTYAPDQLIGFGPKQQPILKAGDAKTGPSLVITALADGVAVAQYVSWLLSLKSNVH